MAEEIAVKVIARIHTDFPEKFGIPRQSGLIEGVKPFLFLFYHIYKSI